MALLSYEGGETYQASCGGIPLTNAMGIAPPLSQQTEQYLPHNNHSVSNISKHMYNCKGTPQLHWFYHSTFFSSAKTTFLAAIKQGYFQGCLGLTYESAKQYITQNEVATIKGHMNQK